MPDERKRIPLTQFRKELERYVERAENGEEIVVTRYGKPQFDLVPHGSRNLATRP